MRRARARARGSARRDGKKKKRKEGGLRFPARILSIFRGGGFLLLRLRVIFIALLRRFRPSSVSSEDER